MTKKFLAPAQDTPTADEYTYTYYAKKRCDFHRDVPGDFVKHTKGKVHVQARTSQATLTCTDTYIYKRPLSPEEIVGCGLIADRHNPDVRADGGSNDAVNDTPDDREDGGSNGAVNDTPDDREDGGSNGDANEIPPVAERADGSNAAIGTPADGGEDGAVVKNSKGAVAAVNGRAEGSNDAAIGTPAKIENDAAIGTPDDRVNLISKPQMIDNLPQELLQQPRFFKVGKNKVPLVQAWSNPQNQCFAKDVDGLVGFDTSGHDIAPDYLLVDCDHILDDSGAFVNRDVRRWLEFFAKAGSYSELSISGNGAHFLFKPTPGKFPPIANGKSGVLHLGDGAKIELFYKTKGRYCLLTGNVFKCPPKAPVVAADAADGVFLTLLQEIAKRLPKPAKSTPTRREAIKNSLPAQIDSSDYDLFRAERMLADINPADLSDSDWLAVMSACKNIGLPYSGVDSFNLRDPDRYHEAENQTRWDSLNDPNYTIETLHGIAKRFNYSEKDSTREWFNLHPELSTPLRRAEKFPNLQSIGDLPPADTDNDIDKKIREWERVNGIINPQILADLKAFALKIGAIKRLSEVAEAATDTAILKMLGLFRFYSPFAHVEKKFTAQLTHSVEEAKAKRKAWDKHIRDVNKYNDMNLCAKRAVDMSKKPNDFEAALALINPRHVAEDIERYKKGASREHKRWLFQHQCNELNAKRDAEKQAYEDAPPTTQQAVTDCPIDLILPEGASFSDDSIKYVDWDKPARDGRPRVEICQNPIVPMKIFINVDDDTVSYEVGIKSDNHWRTGIFTARTFMDSRAVLQLADIGLKISEPRLLAKFFAKFFAINEKSVPNQIAPRLPRIKKFTRPGWHNLDNERIFIDPRDLPEGVALDAGQNGLIPHLKSQGSLDVWRMAYEAAKASPIARAVVAGCVAPPLLDVVGERNFLIYIKGMTRGGKTTCLLLGASAVGTEKIMRSFDATRNALGALAADCSDYPLLIDEGQVADVRHVDQLRQIPYIIANGVGRTRCDRSGKVRVADTWRTIALATGEVSLLDPLTTPEGVITRMLTIDAPKKILPDDVCSIVRANVKENHGLAFPLFIKKILELGAETLKEVYKTLNDAFAEQFPDYLNEHRRYVALLALADTLLNVTLGANFDASLEDAVKFFAKPLFERIATQQEMSLAQEYVDFVQGFIAQNQSHFVGGSGFDITKPQIKIMGKLDDDDGYSYIISRAFDEECERRGLNPRKVAAVLVEAKFFVPDDTIEEGRKSPRLTVKKQIGQSRPRCYRIRSATLKADE